MSAGRAKAAKKAVAKNKATVTAVFFPAELAAWDYANWPAAVFPHDGEKAKHLAEVHRDSLLRAGVLSRVGKKVVWDGFAYKKWIKRQTWREIDMPGGA